MARLLAGSSRSRNILRQACLIDLMPLTGTGSNASTSAAITATHEQPAEDTAAPQEALQEALKHLDMAALMGGPALRPSLDVAITRVQRGMRAAAVVAAGNSPHTDTKRTTAYVRQSQNDDAAGGSRAQMHQSPAKRQRTEASAVTSQLLGRADVDSLADDCDAAEHVEQPALPLRDHAERGATADDANAGADGVAAPELSEDAWPTGAPFTAAPPPGFCDGKPIPNVELPALETCVPEPVITPSVRLCPQHGNRLSQRIVAQRVAVAIAF